LSTTSLRIVVLSPLFPNAADPGAGLFIRERMFRVARSVPLVVVSPQPWFPLQRLIRLFRPRYRLAPGRYEAQEGIEVHFPRFLAFPGVLRWLDGWSMAVCSLPLMLRLRRRFDFTLMDAHFAYPAGYAATCLGRWLGVPVTITLRGTEPGHLGRFGLAPRVRKALACATRIVAVSDSLRDVAIAAGAETSRVVVVGNGVDLDRFRPLSRAQARAELGLGADTKVIVTVGGLVERKGFHRVIDALPALLRRYPDLAYLVVGGPGVEGDYSGVLHDQVNRLGLEGHVRFLGPLSHDALQVRLCAADVFVLASSNEGWANVLLEAMACGLPVVATDVGGNAQVVSGPQLGRIVPFGDAPALEAAIADALSQPWEREAIRAYAERHGWDRRVEELLRELHVAAGVAGRAREALA
jgi:glycosyltransferase involved in cell wall biosynthesis